MRQGVALGADKEVRMAQMYNRRCTLLILYLNLASQPKPLSLLRRHPPFSPKGYQYTHVTSYGPEIHVPTIASRSLGRRWTLV